MNVMRVKEFANVELLGDRKITSFIIGEKIYFKAKDVALALEYANPEKAIRDHAIRKYRVTFGKIQKVNETFTLHPHTVLIQEFGLYEIMMKSHQEKAIMFQEWIYEEVLPSIRKTGQYTVPNKYDAIKGYTQNVLTNGDVDEKKTYHKLLGEQFDFTKVEMGRKGGLKTWENIHTTESQLVAANVKVCKLREENEKLRTVLSAVGTIATVMSQRWLSEQQAS